MPPNDLPSASWPIATNFKLPEGPFVGRESFRVLVRQALACAHRDGWREVIICDADFADWPLGEPELIRHLNDWARAGGQLTVLALDYDEIVRRHSLFVRWRRDWSHRIVCRGVHSRDRVNFASGLWSGSWALVRHDVLRSGGVSGQGALAVRLRETLNGWLERSQDAFPVSVLGL